MLWVFSACQSLGARQSNTNTVNELLFHPCHLSPWTHACLYEILGYKHTHTHIHPYWLFYKEVKIPVEERGFGNWGFVQKRECWRLFEVGSKLFPASGWSRILVQSSDLEASFSHCGSGFPALPMGPFCSIASGSQLPSWCRRYAEHSPPLILGLVRTHLELSEHLSSFRYPCPILCPNQGTRHAQCLPVPAHLQSWSVLLVWRTLTNTSLLSLPEASFFPMSVSSHLQKLSPPQSLLLIPSCLARSNVCFLQFLLHLTVTLKSFFKLFILYQNIADYGFPGGSVVKNPPANAGDTGLIPGLGRSPEERNGNPF